MNRRLSSFAALMLLCLTACTSPASQPTGSVQFAASTQQALSANDITRVKVTVSATDMSPLVVELAYRRDRSHVEGEGWSGEAEKGRCRG